MEWLVADIKIAIVLLAWIVACVGVGNVVYRWLNRINSPLGEVNSPLGNHCVDLAFSHKARTQSPLTLCQNTKNSTSKTADARIFLNANDRESQGDSSDSTESSDKIDSYESLYDSCNDDSNNPHEVPQNLAPLRGAEKEREESRSAFALFMQEAEKARLSPKSETAAAVWRVGERGGGAALFAKNIDSKNENISVESSRSERVESFTENAESLKDSSDFIDFIDSAESSDKIVSHDFATQNLAMTAKDSSTQSPFFAIFPNHFAIKIFASLLFGVIIFSFLTSLLHLFMPITPLISIIFLTLGIALFAFHIRDFHLLDLRVLFSGAVAFAIVAILGFFHDSIGDSVNYHIQIVTWIQNSPLIFGLGNIHGRLGFNGIIYNFYALNDVSQIFPSLRSFIANEIIYFAFIFSVVYILATRTFNRFYLLFIVCCAIPFSFILKWSEFNGLYCEGIGLVFGVFVGAMVIYVLSANSRTNSPLGNRVDFENFECLQTQSLASHQKFSKEAKASTASRRLDEQSEVPNARIFKGDSGDFVESNAESLRDSNDSAESSDKIDSHAMQGNSRNDIFGAIPQKSLESYKPQATIAKPTHFSNALLFVLFIISVFATMIKIANAALVVAVAIIFIYLNRDFYKKRFYKYYAILGILCVIFVLPWALKGVATSGMVAYPAGLFFFKTLPFAVSEAQRSSEVCWIMSWARAPGKNCVEVLADSAWVGEWFSMKTRYFGWYFKYFVYHFLASFALLIAVIIYKKSQKFKLNANKTHIIAFVAMFAGIIFWFFSGPDPRFGMVYIFPLIGFVMALNIREIKNIDSKKARIIFTIAFIATLMPFWRLTRDMYIILILFCVLFSSAILSAKWRKFYYALIIILAFVSIPNIYRKHLGDIKRLPKVLPIYAQERYSDYGVSIFHRSDKPKDGYEAFDYEPMPTTPYFSSHIKEERFLGRKAYINANKDKE